MQMGSQGFRPNPEGEALCRGARQRWSLPRKARKSAKRRFGKRMRKIAKLALLRSDLP